MKKLTFEESRQTLDVLGENGLKEIVAGDGIILSGSGTSSDPYVISSTVYLDQDSLGSNYNSAYNGVSEYNNLGTVAVGGQYYKFDIEIKLTYYSIGQFPQDQTYDLEGSGQVTFRDTYVQSLSGTPSGMTGGLRLGGAMDDTNQTGFYAENIDDFNGVGMDLIERTVAHEIGHTFGLEDGDGSSMMTQFGSSTNTNNLDIGPGALDAEAVEKMLQSDRIHWGRGVVRP